MESKELIFLIVLGLPTAFVFGRFFAGKKSETARALAEAEAARLKQDKEEQKSLWEKQRAEHRETLLQKEEAFQKLNGEFEREKAFRTNDQKELENRREELNRREDFIEQTRKKLLLEIEKRSRELVDEGTESYKKQSKESMSALLDPLKDKIEGFKKQVSDYYGEEGKERRSLQNEVKSLTKAHKTSAEQTKELARALKGSAKAQGDWGEVVLKNILEAAGLREEDDFTLQGKGLNMKTEEGKGLKPDIVIHLPDNRNIIIDAKTSLEPYQKYLKADEAQRDEQGKEVVKSLQRHIKNLSETDYHKHSLKPRPAIKKNLDPFTAPFTFMFVPSDGIYALAVKIDPDLWEKAWRKSIVIVTPVTLLAALKIVDSLWRLEKQNKNARKIALESGKMLDKFDGFLKDMKRIDEGLNKARASYDDAYKKMGTGKGNLMARAGNIKDLLGDKASKELHADRDEDDSKNLIDATERIESLDLKKS